MRAFAYRHLVSVNGTRGRRVRALHEPDAAEDPQCRPGERFLRAGLSVFALVRRRRVCKPCPAGVERAAGWHCLGKLCPPGGALNRVA